jgi:hypothetical protein
MATFGTFTAGQVLTASELNAAGAYTAYTPTYTNVTVGNGTSSFAYTQFNKLVHVEGRFTLGTTSAITGLITMTLPVNLSNTYNHVIGTVSLVDAGIVSYLGFPNVKDVDEVYLFALGAGGTYVSESATSATVPFTWASTDYFAVDLIYRAA